MRKVGFDSSRTGTHLRRFHFPTENVGDERHVGPFRCIAGRFICVSGLSLSSRGQESETKKLTLSQFNDMDYEFHNKSHTTHLSLSIIF
jgi:hypothetical protein